MLPACCSISRMPCWRVQRGRCRATGGRVGGGSGAGRWVALWGQLLDRLNVVAEAERRGLRPIGPGGYTGGECYRALVKPCSPAATSCPTGRCRPTRPPPRCAEGTHCRVSSNLGSVAVFGRGRSGSGDQGRGDQPGTAEPGLGGGDGRRWSARRDRVVHHGPGMWAVRADRVRVGRPDLPAQHERQVGDCPGCSVQAWRACTYSPTSRMNSDPSAWSGSSPPSTTSTPPVR